MPFENDIFVIIINSHEAFDINEVYRLLKPNWLFITPQVNGLNNKELSKFLINDFKEITSSHPTLENNLLLIQNKGFTILKTDECFPKLTFFNVRALVYFSRLTLL